MLWFANIYFLSWHSVGNNVLKYQILNMEHCRHYIPFQFLSMHEKCMARGKAMHVSWVSWKKNSSDLGDFVGKTWYSSFILGPRHIKWSIPAEPIVMSPSLAGLKCHLHGCLFWYLRALCFRRKALTGYRVFWSALPHPSCCCCCVFLGLATAPGFRGGWEALLGTRWCS